MPLAHIYPDTGRARRAGPTCVLASSLALACLAISSSPAHATPLGLSVEMGQIDADLGDQRSSFSLYESYSLPSDAPLPLPLFFELSWTSEGTGRTAHGHSTYEYTGGTGEMRGLWKLLEPVLQADARRSVKDEVGRIKSHLESGARA